MQDSPVSHKRRVGANNSSITVRPSIQKTGLLQEIQVQRGPLFKAYSRPSRAAGGQAEKSIPAAGGQSGKLSSTGGQYSSAVVGPMSILSNLVGRLWFCGYVALLQLLLAMAV